MCVLPSNVRTVLRRWPTACAGAILSLVTADLASAERGFNPDVATWQEVKTPPKSRAGDWMIWSIAANYSPTNWQIKRNGSAVSATSTSNPVAQSSPRPNFIPKIDQFVGADTFQRVDDGWLIGFNQGEFGAALYWFNNDGLQNYKISDDQVSDFMRTPRGIIAIQGLAHLGISEGSLVAIARDSDTKRWRSKTIQKLPEAPDAFVRLSNGTLIVVLSNSLVSLSLDYQMTVLIRCANWDILYPNSVALSLDESKIYIGMRQFVAEFNLATKKLRYLVPGQTFLNHLPKDDQKRLREVYKNGVAQDKDCD